MSTITMDDTFHNYFKDLFIEYIICENCSLVISNMIKPTFTVRRTLKELNSVLIIIFLRGKLGLVHYIDINNE